MDINEFIAKYATSLIASAEKRLKPLYKQGDQLEDLSWILRKPYQAQHEVITATVMALMRQKGIFICAEMGTGKTIMSIAAAHAWALRTHEKDWNHIYGRKREIRLGYIPDPKKVAGRLGNVIQINPYYFHLWFNVPTGTKIKVGDMTLKKTEKAYLKKHGRAFYGYIQTVDQNRNKIILWSECRACYRFLVACPGQLIDKWEREIIQTVPNALVYKIESWRQMYNFWVSWKNRKGYESPIGHVWIVIGRDRLKLSHGWENRFSLRSVVDSQRMGQPVCVCPRCGEPVFARNGDMITERDSLQLAASANQTKRKCQFCGEQLWQSVLKPYRVSPSLLLHRMKGFIDMSIFDEVHEYKGLDSIQGQAMGCVAKVSKKVIGLTGTLSGGYAWHTFANMYRSGCAESLIAEGIRYNNEPEFSKIYGRQEVSITTHLSETSSKRYGRSTGSSSKVRQSKVTKSIPGIMPQLTKHLISSSVFLGLDELHANLPYIDEDVYEVQMNGEQSEEYNNIKEHIKRVIEASRREGTFSKSILSLMLILLQYPDYPFDWDLQGYTVREGNNFRFVPVVKPRSLQRDTFYPKEEEFAQWAQNMIDCGSQVWGYCIYTQKRDCLQRLKSVMESKGLRVAILRSDIPPEDREEWIVENGPKNQVILSHPALVQTGLDFFGQYYNYNCIGFYQCGYNPFVLRQASRRAWRLGQWRDCYVSYFAYSSTLQHEAINLMQRKIAAALALEGKSPKTGLTENLEDADDSIEMLLIKSIMES